MCLRVSTFRHFLLAPHQMGRCTEFVIMEDGILSYDTKLFHVFASCPGSVEYTTVDSFGKFWTSWSDLACIQNNEPEDIAGRLRCSVFVSSCKSAVHIRVRLDVTCRFYPGSHAVYKTPCLIIHYCCILWAPSYSSESDTCGVLPEQLISQTTLLYFPQSLQCFFEFWILSDIRWPDTSRVVTHRL